jgi:hypothetical protein
MTPELTTSEPWKAITADLILHEADKHGYRLGFNLVVGYIDKQACRCCAVGALALDDCSENRRYEMPWQIAVRRYGISPDGETALSDGFEDNSDDTGDYPATPETVYLHAVGAEVRRHIERN